MRLDLCTDAAAIDQVLPGLAALTGHTSTTIVRRASVVETAGCAVTEPRRACDAVVVDARGASAVSLDLCRRLRRAAPSIPIVAVVADADFARVGPEWCVDGVVSENADPAEVGARLRLLRNVRPIVEAGALEVDRNTRVIRLRGRALTLGPREFRLLSFLAAHPDRIFTRGDLVHEVYDVEQVVASDRAIDVLVCRVRNALGRDRESLITVPGRGYRFCPPCADPGLEMSPRR